MNENETMGPEMGNEQYIQAIKDLKENSVSKDMYERMKKENQQLLDTLVQGGTIETPKEKPELNQLRKELFKSKDLTNLEFCQKALELRAAVIEDGGADPFLPNGKMYSPDFNDVATANKVAEALQSCIDYADGDSQVFTMELQRIMKDSAPVRRK